MNHDNQEHWLAQLHDRMLKQPPHAFLVTASDSVDKEIFIRKWLSQRLLANTHLMDIDNHPDLHWISPSGVIEQIKVDDIRAAIIWSQTSPLLGDEKWIVIASAEKLNEAASHALLKVLEEPPTSVRFILISRSIQRLKPTIRSRVCRFHLQEKHDTTLPANAWNEECLHYLLSSSTSLNAFVDWGQSDVRILLEYWQKILHDLLLLQQDEHHASEFLYQQHSLSLLKEYAIKANANKLWEFCDVLNEMSSALQSNVVLNTTLLLTRLLLMWQTIFDGQKR